MTGRLSVLSVRLVVLAALLAVPQSSMAQVSDVQVDVAGFDAVGDAPQAPDIGKVQHSVLPNAAYRTVVIGVWLNRSDLAEGERVDVYLDWKANSGGLFGGDHRFVLHGHAPSPDLYETQGWNGVQWIGAALRNPSVSVFGNGRVYFGVDFDPGTSTPENPAGIGLRVSSAPGVPNALIDYAPDTNLPNIGFSLEPHGLPDPLDGCTYSGGCVGPASGPGNFGPSPNTPGGAPSAGGGTSGGRPSTACSRARRKARVAGRKLASARARLRRAHSRAQRRKVRHLKRRHSALKRIVAARC